MFLKKKRVTVRHFLYPWHPCDFFLFTKLKNILQVIVLRAEMDLGRVGHFFQLLLKQLLIGLNVLTLLS
jgi:hypothetical protein